MSDDGHALAKTIHAKQDKLAPESVTFADEREGGANALAATAPRSRGVMDEQFPTASLGAKDARDREMMARLKLQTPEKPGVTPFGKLQARDEDFKWLQKKQAAVEAANFQAWFAKEFDHMSPADKKRAKELYPEFYAQRKKLLKRQTKNLQNLARIKIEGIQSKDDLITVYLAETGRLDIGPLNHLLNPEQDAESIVRNEARFRRGLLSPFRVFGDEVVNVDGNSNATTRAQQSSAFAERTVSADTIRAGANGVRFPAFTEDSYNQGDKQWYDMLSQ